MANEKQFLAMLIDALQLVAAEADTQLRALPSFVHVPDEVALLYDDCFRLAGQVSEAGLIDARQFAKLRELDQFLDLMSNTSDPELWTVEGLIKSPEWAESRRLAQEALVLLGVAQQPPNIGWGQYVRGGKEEG